MQMSVCTPMTKLLITILLCPVLGTRRVLVRDATHDSKSRPVMKVVRLLQDMGAQLQKELDDDKAVYDTLTCWCTTNSDEKTKAIELSESNIAQLESSMSEDAARVVQLKEKRAETMAEIDKDINTLKVAQEIRFKENKAFQAEAMDLMEAAKACSQAVEVLSKHHPELAQLKSMARKLQDARVPDMFATSQNPIAQLASQALRSFLRETTTASSFLSIPGMRSYAPQSGQIFGLLKQMEKDFNENLADAEKIENKAREEFEALRAAKEDEIAAGKAQVVQLDADIAALGEKAAQEAKQLEETKTQLAMDQEFLADLKAKCAVADKEFESRTKSRLEEIAAVEDTIKILNTDEAFTNFGKSFGLLQIRSSTKRIEKNPVRQHAALVLSQAAGRIGAPRLALLAASVQLDAFKKVKEEIDKLVAEMKKQQQDEVDTRDWCTAEMNTNGRNTQKAYDEQKNLQTKETDLTTEIAQLTKKIEELQAESAEIMTQMKRASSLREAENSDFQEIITDQRLTQAILDKALARMKQVYALLEQQPGAPHIATSATNTDAGNGPARFTKYEQNAGGSRVVNMLEEVIADSKKTEGEALRGEGDSQAAYEEFMKGSNKALKENAKSVASMTEAKARSEEELEITKTDLKGNMEELEGLNAELGDLHKQCDFLLNNFEVRQQARAAEIEAMIEAKNILSGMN